MGDVGAWPLRAAWLALPLAAASALSAAVAARSGPVAAVLTVLLWGGWAGGLVAALAPHPLGLTALRVLSPAALVAAAWAFLDRGPSPASLAAAAGGVVVVLAVLAPPTVDALVDGASYGPERRMALRVPAPLLLGPLPLAVAVAIAGVAAGPLLLAAEAWLAGAAALAVGLPLARVALSALHGLSRRVVVFVPAGFVLADRTVLGEPVLVPRATMARLAPAVRGTSALDLSARALGLLLQVDLAEPATFPLRRGRHDIDEQRATAFLVAPMRPGAFLRHAASSRLPVG